MKKEISLALLLALALTASVATADYTFGTPTNLGPPVNSGSDEWGSSISSDGLELYFESNRPGGEGGYDIWVSTRATKEDDWGVPMNLGAPINTSAWETMPRISADGLALYFTGPDGLGGVDLWVTTREIKEDEWGTPVNLGPTVNSGFFEGGPAISSDGLELYFISDRPGGSGSFDLWVTTRATPSDPWGEPVNLGPTINSSVGEWYPSISADGLVLFFQDDKLDICLAQRKSTDESFGPAVQLPSQINTSRIEGAPSLSYDGSTLYFASNNSGGYGKNDIWQVSIDPVVDFTGDLRVDIEDLILLIEHWGQNEPTYDMGPMPWGDGIVDVQDLVVLTKYMEPLDPALIAHWKLDEAEGNIANSLGIHDAIVMGEAVWQPEGGWSGGALLFDGIDDHLVTDFVIDPSRGPMSIFAWIKGGAPGQAIVSQGMSNPMFGSTWLGIDPEDGRLVTGHMYPIVPLLESDVVITDDQWHRVGLVWDGTFRHLFVDGEEVMSDPDKASHMPSPLGLYIGADSHLTEGSFWSGLIDDVRIYDRVVEP